MNRFQCAYEYIWLRWINRRPSPACCELLRLLQHRENWVVGQHVMVHKASKVGIWIANGSRGVRVKIDAEIHADCSTNSGTGDTVELSRRDRRAIWKVFRSWHAERRDLVDLYWKLKGHN